MALRSKTFVLRRPEQVAALGSAVRCQLVDSLAVHGPSSVRDLATRLGRRPEALYYHIRALVDVGIVVLTGKRKAKRRAEAIFGLVAPRLTIDPRQRSGAYASALAGSCAALLRLAARNYRAAVERGDFTLDGAQRSLMARRCTVRLTRDGLSRLNRHLNRLFELLNRNNRANADEAYAVSVALTRLDEPANL